jgi:hypothetical protein
MEAVSITSEPKKTNTSYGRWVVDYEIIYPAFSGTAVVAKCSKFFWTKKQAIAWIAENNKGETK